MNYELAKKLKDAGFMQPDLDYTGQKFLMRENADGREGEYDPVNDRTMWIGFFSPKYVEENIDLVVYVPTLSELIEACGEDFDRLMLKNGAWAAYATIEKYRVPGFILHWCNTPEEAVANLYLELNKIVK